jgi:hypothetical protein
MVRVVRRLGRGWLVVALAGLSLAGCAGGDEGGVKTYRIATAPQKERGRIQPDDHGGTPPTVPDGPPKVRFLGAIIPAGEGSSYFVRFFGPIDKITAHEKAFDAFLNSIRVPGEGGKPVSWTVPPGWKVVPNPPQAAGLRLVTLKTEDGSSEDLYISTPIAGDNLANVNRWRTDFVGIPAVKDLKDAVTEIQLGPTKALRVDFRGPGGGKGRG